MTTPTGSGTGPTAAQRIAAGYATTSASVVLGSVVTGAGTSDAGTVDPTALVQMPLSMFNRHGLVAGATGTGKTKTLQVIAEQLSAAGVPVFLPDVKGDLTGLALPGSPNTRIEQRAAETGDDWVGTGYPVEFLTLAGQGVEVPVRATVDSFGPILLSKVLGLNETQESTLGLIFHWADARQLPLLDLKDLRAVIMYLTSDEGKADLKELGGVSKATAGVILRNVTNLDAQGGDQFFGEPELDIADLLRQAPDGRGVITLLECAALQTKPVLFSTFLMWLLAELFEALPEVGDVDAPKLVFLFDEAHLLFADASKAFLQAVQQTVKLIRSKGVGVFFCTQMPTDVPGPVLSQLGARIQHALRAFTPEDQKALSATVKTYPFTDDYDLSTALTGLGTGEAIVTVLSERGAPTPVAWTRVRAPRSLMAPAPVELVTQAVAASALTAKYGTAVDRESAYEILAARVTTPEDAPDTVPTVPLPPTAPWTGPVSTGPAAPARVPSAPSLGADGWPTLDPGIAMTYPTLDPEPPVRTRSRSTAKTRRPAPADYSEPQPRSTISDVLESPMVTSFFRSLGTAAGGALGRSIFGPRSKPTRRRR